MSNSIARKAIQFTSLVHSAAEINAGVHLLLVKQAIISPKQEQASL